MKIKKGFEELAKAGLIEPTKTRMSGAQATGCSPVATAWEEGSMNFRPQRPDTIAKSLAIGNPADGYYSLVQLRDTGGACGNVSDPEIVAGMKLLAETEGIFAETAGGVTVASLKQLAEQGRIGPDEVTVAFITGASRPSRPSPGRSSPRSDRRHRRSFDTPSRRAARCTRGCELMPERWPIHGDQSRPLHLSRRADQGTGDYRIGHEFNVITNVRMADVDEQTGWVLLEIEGEPAEIRTPSRDAEHGVRVDPVVSTTWSRVNPSPAEAVTATRNQQPASCNSEDFRARYCPYPAAPSQPDRQPADRLPVATPRRLHHRPRSDTPASVSG